MSLLAFSKVSFQFSCGTTIFTHASLAIDPGDRIALVGPNGAGKSTFLHLVTGALQPSEGTIARRRGLQIAFCEQDEHAKSQSGGEHMRAKLSYALAQDADLLLLDEPTNHLDLHSREWLERKLSRTRQAIVMASHDRAFLKAFAQRVIEIERGELRVYNTGYAEYRQSKGQNVERQWAAYEGYQRRKEALVIAAEKRDQLSAKVERTPEGIRGGKHFYRRKAGKVARTGRLLRERLIDLGEEVEKPWQVSPMEGLTFDQVVRSGDFVLQTENLTVSGLFEGLDFHLRRGDRLAITGDNGSGKTTLLKVLTGQIRPDAGSVRLGANVRIASIEQALEKQMDFAQTPLEICGTSTPARTLLGCLRLPATCLNRPLASLSAGERMKVAMAMILNSTANLLLLDEPTNQLEVDAQEALEQALGRYPGTAIAVSHDRAFLAALGDRLQRIELPLVRLGIV